MEKRFGAEPRGAEFHSIDEGGAIEVSNLREPCAIEERISIQLNAGEDARASEITTREVCSCGKSRPLKRRILEL